MKPMRFMVMSAGKFTNRPLRQVVPAELQLWVGQFVERPTCSVAAADSTVCAASRCGAMLRDGKRLVIRADAVAAPGSWRPRKKDQGELLRVCRSPVAANT